MKKRKIAFWILGFYIAVALFHPFIANEKPLFCKIEGKSYFPVIAKKNLDLGEASNVIMPLIPFSSSSLDTKASFSPPFSGKHLLGTDILGRDTLAGILNGTEIAVKVGFGAVFIAALIALVMGLFVSFVKRFPIRVSLLQLILFTTSICALIYFTWISWYTSYAYFFIPFFILLLVNVLVWKFLKKGKRSFILPIDGAYLRVVEAMKSLPGLVLLLACLTLFERFSVTNLIMILAFLMWPGISRHVRAESLKVLNQDYVLAAKVYGASSFRILWKHVLPKTMTSIAVILAFSISSAIVIESTLSFLGLGIPIEQVSWGSMLKEAQRNISAWWLAVFPGLALFGLILCLNMLGERKA